MNKTTKILIGILVIVIVIVGGGWILDNIFTTKPLSICGPSGKSYWIDISNCNTSCQTDEDCKFTCGCGAINKKEGCYEGGTTYDCVERYVKCENSICVAGEEKKPQCEVGTQYRPEECRCPEGTLSHPTFDEEKQEWLQVCKPVSMETIYECKEFRAGIKTELNIEKGIGVYYTQYVQPPQGERYSVGPYIKFGRFMEDILYYYEKSAQDYTIEEKFSEGEIVLIDNKFIKKIDSQFNNIDSFHQIVKDNIKIIQNSHEECFSIAAPESEYKPHIYLVDSISNEIILLYDAPILIKAAAPLIGCRFAIFIDVYQGKIEEILVYGLILE